MATPNKDILELKFDGNDINPSTVRPHEIAELINNFEKALLSTIKENHPEIDTNEVLFSFQKIDDKSLDLFFVPRLAVDIVIASYLLISNSVANEDYSKLNNETISYLRSFTKFSKDHECIGYFNKNGKTLSSFSSNTEINYNKKQLVQGEITIFGKVIDSGGEKPNVHLRINDEDKPLIFDTTEENARKLAAKLYQKVALKGVAKWEPDTLKVDSFILSEILDYSAGNTLKAIKKLKKITSGFWNQFNTNDDINNQLLRE